MAGTSGPLRAETPTAAGARRFPARILAAHNLIRARVGVPPLRWDNRLGTEAAKYAVQLAMSSRFAHASAQAREGAGENLWMGTRGAFSVEAMVGSWASEMRTFSGGVFPYVTRRGSWHDVGHYTQMIWPTTTDVGCAMYRDARYDWLICRYSPPGNIDNRPVP
jgi:hypothetical protein